MQPVPRPPVASQWIRANAGSGKTTVLTQQVVKLLLLGVPPERICCITYTKAAAGEMRARILRDLRELLLADEPTCRARIEERTGERATPEMLRRARQLFGLVLDSPSGGIELTTIHGFCQQILRAFPIEAGVAPNFTIADDMQTAQLHAQVKRRLLGSDAQAPDVAAAIALLAERCGEAQFDTLMRALLALKIDRTLPFGEWKQRLYAHLDVTDGMNEEQLATATLDCLNAQQKDTLRAALPGLMREKTAYKRAVGDGGARWLEGTISIDEWLLIWLTKTEQTPIKNLLKGMPPVDALGDVVAHCIATAERFVARRAALALAEESAAALALARQLQALYAQVKAERGVLDYEDLIVKTRELLTLTDMVGWVMSKLDHRIDHLLVDEAQDTSAEQWNIAHVLVDELFASNGGEGSAGVPRSVFVVGDEKQSIFSFQGAAPKLYADMQGRFDALLAPTINPLTSVERNVSFRSAQAILRAVDAVAQDPLVAPALSAIGLPQPHEVGRRAKAGEVIAGEVVIHPPILPEEKTTLPAFTIPKEYAIIRSPAQLLAEHVADTVAGWIGEGAWRAGDILILTRNRRPIVLPLLRALQRKGVPVAGIDRLVLAEHLAVKDLLALMRWVLSPNDDLALAQVLRSPLMGWSDEQLRAAAVGRDRLSLWSRVAPEATLERWRQAAQASPYDFLTQVLEADATRRAFARRFGAEVHEILDELKEQAMALPAGMAPSLANFEAWIRGSDRQIKRELEAGEHDHVRVMTVHGSKGLEAPMVLMVDTVGVPSLSKELLSATHDAHGQTFPLLALSDTARQATVWCYARDAQQRDQLAEYQRLLYVAMTRPQDALHVFAMAPGRGEIKPDCWYETIRRGLQSLPETTEEADGMLVLRDAGQRVTRPRYGAAHSVAPMPAWMAQALPKTTRVSALSPSNLAREKALAPFAKARGESAKERGVRLHRVLQFLDAHTQRAQVEQLIAHLAPDWSDAQRQEAAMEIWTLYEAERWLWQNPARAEATIAGTFTRNGVAYPVLGQIDLLVETPEAIVLLDYKTGRAVPETAEGVSEGYLLQLKLYQALLETLYPGKRVRPAILWTANARLMWLDAAVSRMDWERAQWPQTP